VWRQNGAVDQSPIEQFLDALDRLELEAAMALMAPDARVLVADGRRAEGTDAVRQLFGDFLAQLRSTSHRITAQWHEDDVWIAEVDASYELRDRLQLNALPRAFIVRAGPDGVSELRTYGAHEHSLSDHPAPEGGVRFGGQWAPPL
jgi:SnoaL-like domain